MFSFCIQIHKYVCMYVCICIINIGQYTLPFLIMFIVYTSLNNKMGSDVLKPPDFTWVAFNTNGFKEAV
jgi:hypothetical protein